MSNAAKGKDVAYYLSLPYRFTVHREANADGPYWAARVAEIGGISGMGETAAAALTSVEESLRLWLEDAIEDGLPIPEPTGEPDVSGKFALRMARALHRDVASRADRESVSLNAWINTVLARYGT